MHLKKGRIAYYLSSVGFVFQVIFIPPVILHESKQQPEARPCRALPSDAPSSESSQGGEDRCFWATSAYRDLQMKRPQSLSDVADSFQ